MPFTFSHPIFAAPLKAAAPKYFSLSGLILGSMAPDFEYFLLLEPYRTIGHTIPGFFLQALPLSILFFILFHMLVKRPLAEHLPSWFRLDERAVALISDPRLRDWRQWLIFLISVTIGFATHIFIDEWTHRPGYFVRLFPFMQSYLFGLPVFKFLQYSCSLAGLALQLGLILMFLSRVQPSSSGRLRRTGDKWTYWGIVIAVGLFVTIGKLALTSSTNTLGILIVAPISGSLLGILIASIWARLRARRRSVAA